MELEEKRFYEFGPFRLDAVKRLLLKEGETVSLTPKAFDTLVALVENSGSVVGKDYLIERVWPDSFVEEGNLTVNISMLRKALGESPSQHRYIVTVPGRGYRFVADVREVFEEETDLVVEEHARARIVIEHEEIAQEREKTAFAGKETSLVNISVPATVLRNRRLSLKAIVASVLLLVIAIASALWWFRPGNHPDRDWLSSLRLIQVVGLRSERKETMKSGRLSPDGKMLVYCASREGLSLYLMQIGGDQPIPITRSNWNDASPIWSPDGQQIAFISNRGNQIGIWAVPFLGGSTVSLKVLEPNNSIMKGDTALLHWSKDGSKIYFEFDRNLYTLDLASKETAQLTSFELSSQSPTQFRFSPNEESVAYIDGRDGQFDIWMMPREGGAPTRITNDEAVERKPLWLPDGQRLVYSANIEGRFRLFMAYLDGRPPLQITFLEDNGSVWDVSTDGTRVLYHGKRDESDLWRVRIDTGEETQLTSDISLEFWPQPAPDGASLTFQSVRGEQIVWNPKKSRLMMQSLSQDNHSNQLVSDAFEAQWSPDGQKIAFLRSADNLNNLWTVRAIGSEEKQLTVEGVISGGFTIAHNLFQTKDYCWSPDSAKIAYCSKKGGAPNVWIISSDGSSETKISNNADPDLNFACPVWSPDGRLIAYVTNTGGAYAEGNPVWSLWLTDT